MCTTANCVSGEGLDSIHSETYTNPGISGYLVPNETNPVHQRLAFSAVPRNSALLTVGGLRAWIGFALCRNCTSLVIADSSPSIVHFNRLFRLLIRASRGNTMEERHRDFLNLVYEASETEWRDRFRERNLTAEFLNIAREENDGWAWWNRAFRENRELQKVLRDERQSTLFPVNLNGLDPFRSLFTFVRIAEAVDNHRVGISAVNLDNPTHLARLVQSLRDRGVRIGVFDASTMWLEGISNIVEDLGFPGRAGLRRILHDGLTPILHRRAVMTVASMRGRFRFLHPNQVTDNTDYHEILGNPMVIPRRRSYGCLIALAAAGTGSAIGLGVLRYLHLQRQAEDSEE